MAYRDIKNSIDTAKRERKEEGLAEGMEKGMNQRSFEIAKKQPVGSWWWGSREYIHSLPQFNCYLTKNTFICVKV